MSFNPFSLKYLRRSLSSLSLNSKSTPDLTSMEVQKKAIREIKHQSSSSLLNVKLASSKSFVPTAHAPPVPPPPLRTDLATSKKRLLNRHRRIQRKNKTILNSRVFANDENLVATAGHVHVVAVWNVPLHGTHTPREWFEFEDTWGALIYIISQLGELHTAP